MCLSYHMNEPYVELLSHVLTNWKTVVSHCRLPESGAVRHQSKTQKTNYGRTLREQRVSSYTLYCNLPRGHYCEMLRQRST